MQMVIKNTNKLIQNHESKEQYKKEGTFQVKVQEPGDTKQSVACIFEMLKLF